MYDVLEDSHTTAHVRRPNLRSAGTSGLEARLFVRCTKDIGVPPQVSVAAPDWTAVQTVVAELQSASSLAAGIRRLKEMTGLSWGQVAALFGVSRRALHLWAQGGNMTARHADRLAALQAAIARYDAGTPQRTRSQLLAPDEFGDSAYSRLLREAYGEPLFRVLPPLEQLETTTTTDRQHVDSDKGHVSGDPHE